MRSPVSHFCLRSMCADRGVPANDLTVLRFADFGCLVYGHALIINPAFATKNPEAVKAFVRATLSGVRMAIKNLEHAIDVVMTQMNNSSRDIELERLQTSIHDNIITDEVKQNGLGGIETHRFEAAMDQIAEGYTFRKRPSVADIFDESFLPPADRPQNQLSTSRRIAVFPCLTS